MKILLDECLDWRLLRELPGHDVQTVRGKGWAEQKNGALLQLAASEFDVFITADTGIPFQNYLDSLALRVIVLKPRRNRLAELRLLAPQVMAALSAQDGKKLTVIAAL